MIYRVLRMSYVGATLGAFESQPERKQMRTSIELELVKKSKWIEKCILKEFDDGFDYNMILHAPIFKNNENLGTLADKGSSRIMELNRVEDGASFIIAFVVENGRGEEGRPNILVLKERD